MAHGQKIIEKILEILQAQAETSATLLDIFTSDYSTSYRKARSGRFIRFKTDWAESYRESQRFYSMLNHLKREGFIKKEKSGKSSIWLITRHGLSKLKLLRRRQYAPLLQEADENGGHSAVWNVVIFDIPEKERHKRAWLRSVLVGMGFEKRQQSVWLGKGKIPKEFLHDLRAKRLLPHVDIFSIVKSGMLKDLLK